MKKKKNVYYHYGEGSVWHSGEDRDNRVCNCKYAKDLPGKHPVVIREEWPNRRAYLINKHVRLPIMDWQYKHIRLIGDKYFDYGRIGNMVGKIADKLFGVAHPDNPGVRLPLHPDDSIYDRREDA